MLALGVKDTRTRNKKNDLVVNITKNQNYIALCDFNVYFILAHLLISQKLIGRSNNFVWLLVAILSLVFEISMI